MNSTDLKNNLKIVYPNKKDSIRPVQDRARRFIKIRKLLVKNKIK